MLMLALEEPVEVRELAFETPHHRDNRFRIRGTERSLKLLALKVEILQLFLHRPGQGFVPPDMDAICTRKTGD